MTEDDALAWLRTRFDAAQLETLGRFVDLVIAETAEQNLISPATIPHIWARHVVDSLQLTAMAPAGVWLDVGTGGGFPGMAIAIVRNEPMILVEPRRKRAEFLERCAATLGLPHVRVAASKVESVREKASVISARAVASIEKLLRAAAPCATPRTRWLLPRGTVDPIELAEIAAEFGMMFHVEQSVTQAESSIVVLNAR